MAKRRWVRLLPDVRREIIRRAARGATTTEIMETLDLSDGAVCRALRPLGGVFRPDMWTASSARLSLEERIEIRLGLERGWSLRRIAASIGRNVSTVSREVKSNGGRRIYRPTKAQERAARKARRPKPTKLQTNMVLRDRVIADLEQLWSPVQISKRLRLEFEDDPTMSISHETIYKSLYVQGRGELRKELARCLRTGRKTRKQHGRLETKGSLRDMVMIGQRPAEVEDRAVPGHWEGDLILGANNRSAIGTLVERTTRFVLLLHLPNDRQPQTVREAMARAITTLPAALRRSITWDQGKEAAEHARFTIDTGVQIYFCDPSSPWQRASNENTNKLLRQYFPKATDLSIHTATDLQRVADELNRRPRQTLGWMTPSETFSEVVASTA
jgi:IS30 family transposase